MPADGGAFDSVGLLADTLQSDGFVKNGLIELSAVDHRKVVVHDLFSLFNGLALDQVGHHGS